MRFPSPRAWNLDLDRYTSRIIPPSQLYRLPTPVSRFLGYRETKQKDVGDVLAAFWALLGAFCGLSVLALVFRHTGSIWRHHPPVIAASFGASAVLHFNAIHSPLGQPRNALIGHSLSAIIGVSISKLFQLHSDYESIKWIAGALACGIASAVMLPTGTLYPPGGASAVLAAVEPDVTDMGWYFIPLVVWCTTLILSVAMVLNNVQRQFPLYWWTPLDLRRVKDNDQDAGRDEMANVEKNKREANKEQVIQITGTSVIVPYDLSLDPDEAKMLERLRDALLKKANAEREKPEVKEQGIGSSRSSMEATIVPSRRDVEMGDEKL